MQLPPYPVRRKQIYSADKRLVLAKTKLVRMLYDRQTAREVESAIWIASLNTRIKEQRIIVEQERKRAMLFARQMAKESGYTPGGSMSAAGFLEFIEKNSGNEIEEIYDLNFLPCNHSVKSFESGEISVILEFTDKSRLAIDNSSSIYFKREVYETSLQLQP